MSRALQTMCRVLDSGGSDGRQLMTFSERKAAIPREHSGRTRHKIMAVVGAAGLLSGLLAANWARHLENPRPAAPVRFGAEVPAGRGGLVDGQPVSLSEAGVDAGFSLYRPNDSLASDDSLTAAFIDHRGGDLPTTHVSLEYASGINVMLEPAFYSDSATRYKSLAAELGDTVTVQTVDGRPAIIVPENDPEEATGTNAGSVTFVVNGIQVQITGHYSSAELLRIASSVEAGKTSNTQPTS